MDSTGSAERVVTTTDEPSGRYGASLTPISMTNSTALDGTTGDGEGTFVGGGGSSNVSALLFGGYTGGRALSDEWFLLEYNEGEG